MLSWCIATPDKYTYSWAQMKLCSCSVEFAFACARICECVRAHLRIARNFAGEICVELARCIFHADALNDSDWLTCTHARWSLIDQKNLLDYINWVCLFMNAYDYWINKMHNLVLIVAIVFLLLTSHLHLDLAAYALLLVSFQ